jgi:predicted RNase H-like HicB family nuclease
MTSAAQPVAGLTFSWPEEDGWKGACAELGLTVNGGDFEEAKQNMEMALQAHIGSVRRERKMAA